MKTALFAVFVIAIIMLLHSKLKKKTLKNKRWKSSTKRSNLQGSRHLFVVYFCVFIHRGKYYNWQNGLCLESWIKYLKKDTKLLKADTSECYSVRFPSRTMGSVDGRKEWRGKERKDESVSQRDFLYHWRFGSSPWT